MQTYKTLNDAIALAEFAHRNQTDKAGLPYIEHPKRVLARVQGRGALPYVQIAAVMHDVPEDTRFSHDILLSLGFPEPVVVLTRLLDRGYSEKKYRTLRQQQHVAEHGEFLNQKTITKQEIDDFYYNEIRENPDALMIKDEDINDNTELWRLSYFGEEKKNYLVSKYTHAHHRLHPEGL
jgi:(p)ppGpp synthase/HD superfamily hydrolase